MADAIRWGIIGAGKISAKFATGLRVLPDARIQAVAAREADRAAAFGREQGVARSYGAYEDLAADPDVDVIYVGTVNSAHRDNVLLCLESGKPVLCEKPFTLNARQAEEIVGLARDRGLFLMEAMWTRFFPVVRTVRRWLARRRIGEVRLVQAAFGHTSGQDPEGRLLNRALGGGSLLDVGIYPLALASMVYGKVPETILGLPCIGDTGVDESAGLLLRYPGGGLAVLASSVKVETGYDAHICGDGGVIKIHSPFWRPTHASLHIGGKEVISVEEPYLANGYEYQAVAVMDCLREGMTECPEMPLDESLSLMRTMDEIRSQWGLKYPGEQ